MIVMKRNKSGEIVSRGLLTSGGMVPIAVVVKPAVKVAKVAKVPKTPKFAESNAVTVRCSRDASDGEKLAFKLNLAIQLEDPEKMQAACFALGKLARDIGSGDPDVQAALSKARTDQAQSRVTFFDDTDLFNRWSTYFWGGFTARRTQHGEGPCLPYRLAVTIVSPRDGKSGGDIEEHAASYATFGAAEHSAMRWWVLKSETGQHGNMRVEITRLETETIGGRRALVKVPNEEGKMVPVVSKRRDGSDDVFVITKQSAAARYENVRRCAERKPTMFAPKTSGKTLGFGVKVKNYVATFSGG